MARESRKETEKNHSNLLNNRRVKNTFRNLSNIIGQMNLSTYGTDRNSDVDSLNQTFQNLMKNDLESITGKGQYDDTSYLSKLNSQDKKATAIENIISTQFMDVSGETNSSLQAFIQDAYKNRLVEQKDLHEVSSALIELSEAILITRDAIVSAEVVEGRMSRTLDFENSDASDLDDYIPVIEHMEKKFKLLEKIKNFVIPRTLEYGEYYVYTIPYSKIFNDFMVSKNHGFSRHSYYKETTLYDFEQEKLLDKDTRIISESTNRKKKNKKDNLSFAEKVYNEYVNEINKRKTGKAESEYQKVLNESNSDIPNKEAFISDINNMISNITICNDSVPLPVFKEGMASLQHLRDEYINESGNKILTEAEKGTNKTPRNATSSDNFNKIISGVTPEGVQFTKDSKSSHSKDDFSDISDCYIELIEPTRVIPVKIMNQILGYYFVQADEIRPLDGAVSATLYYSKFEENNRQQTVIDTLAKSIIDSFDKDFLKENEQFKELIVKAINYYNLNERRLRFQYIPVEYMQVFKIDEDENGNGQSMIKKSLFYAKLYLMLLLFKIMSIIMNSNDMKVNYIKSSGIDKNVANKVQEIARIKQSRQINMYDLFNYTTLINKVGNGNEMYVPTGRSGERPIETEILSGQDIQLNTELMENLKNSYILGTGVPAAIVNYMNEADFAKVVEQNNTKFNGRVVNYQLDFNSSITEWYKKIMYWSTQIPENLINNFTFTLQPPKSVASSAKTEAIGSFQQYKDFVVNLMYGDNGDNEVAQQEIEIFTKKLADDQLPMLNIPELEKLKNEAKLEYTEYKLKPKPENGDNGDDLGLDGLGDM